MAFLFKTKTRATFSSTIISLSSYAAYDKFIFKQRLTSLKERAKVVSDQPMAVNEIPRKVIVYTSKSQYATHIFERFVKPVFGALDYEVVETKVEYAEHVAGNIRVGIEEASRRPSLPVATPRTWNAFLFGTEEVKRVKGKYECDDGIVVVGDDVFAEVCRGILEGCYALKPSSDATITEVPSDGIVASDSTDTLIASDAKVDADIVITDTADKDKEEVIVEASTEPIVLLDPLNLPHQTPSHLPTQTYNTFDIQPIKFIKAHDLVGVKYFFSRVFMWFHERWNLESIGEEALKVVLFELDRSKVNTVVIVDVNVEDESKIEAFEALPEEIKARTIVMR